MENDDNKKLRRRIAAKKYNEANRDKVLKRRREFYKLNAKRLKEDALQRYYDKRDSNLNRMKEYKRNHKARVNELNVRRKAKKLQATPKWLTEQHLIEIREWYSIATELQWLSEEKLHVDHIVPLQGKEVCGLHVPWNLQVLPASENISKGNRLE